MPRAINKIEFGDFQTPDALAAKVVKLLGALRIVPRSVVEPTCGSGAFVLAALRGFESLRALTGLEINRTYLDIANARVTREEPRARVDLRCGDFFQTDWTKILGCLPQPVLILGNPPWVTASGLGATGGSNAPEKSNFQKHRGLDALTGKSNFDIAEWMLLRLMEASAGMESTTTMLIKTSVARRLLLHVWRSDFPVAWSHLYRFDAARYFHVAADACLFICHLGAKRGPATADIFELDRPFERIGRIGYHDGTLIAEVAAYEATKHLLAAPRRSLRYRWRSGIKHDCAAVMELRRTSAGAFVNGRGESVAIEAEYVYPMLKGSDVATGRVQQIDRYLLVTQQTTGEDTGGIRSNAPRTWEYLTRHKEALNARRSSIYRKRPPFSVFGVGPYTFAPWKVAICGLYKRLSFALVGPSDGRPVVFDDTVYCLACETFDEASLLLGMVTSETASRFFEACIFWDSKRPITADVLNRLDLARLADHLGLDGTFFRRNPRERYETQSLFKV